MIPAPVREPSPEKPEEQVLFRKLKERLIGAERVLVGTHHNPDGDALGSALGFSLWLDRLGVAHEVVNQHRPPRNLLFLPGADRIVPAPSAPADFAVVLDLDPLKRLGEARVHFEGLPYAVVDHHIPHEMGGEIRIVDTDAAATALILARLLDGAGEEITPEMATCFYTGIVTDTGSFRFRNTSPEALSVAAMLLERGAAFVEVSEEIFQSRQLASARLLGRVLAGMRLEKDDRLAWGAISREDFRWAGANDEDTEGFVNELLSIDTVQVAAMLRENEDKVRCSIRSRGGLDVAEAVRPFGGGGHKNAAGCSFALPLAEASALLTARLRELV